MAEVQMPFGLRNSDGRMVAVDAVPNGLACQCSCPECGTALQAVQGEKNQHHFRHDADRIDCEGARETALHKMAKQIILECGASEFELPSGNWGPRSGAVVEAPVEKFRVDVLLQYGAEPVAVEIVVTHPVGLEKERRLQALELATMEVDLSRLHRKMNPTEGQLRDLVLRKANRGWISRPLFLRREQAEHLARIQEREARKLEAEHQRQLAEHRRQLLEREVESWRQDAEDMRRLWVNGAVPLPTSLPLSAPLPVWKPAPQIVSLRERRRTDFPTDWFCTVSRAAQAFEARWTLFALKRVDQTAADRLDMARDSFSRVCHTEMTLEIAATGAALCRAYQLAIEVMEAVDAKDDAYQLGRCPLTGTMIAIGDQKAAISRIRETQGADVVHMTPSEVATLVGLGANAMAFAAEVKRLWPGADVIDVRKTQVELPVVDDGETEQRDFVNE